MIQRSLRLVIQRGPSVLSTEELVIQRSLRFVFEHLIVGTHLHDLIVAGRPAAAAIVFQGHVPPGGLGGTCWLGKPIQVFSRVHFKRTNICQYGLPNLLLL